MAEHVVKSWNKVKEIPNYEIVGGEILFRKIFELAPGAEKMFSFGRSYEPGSDEMFASTRFKVHATAVFHMMDAAIELVKAGKTSDLAEALVKLGKRHYQYGVRSAHYPIVGKALIYTLETALGEEFTPAMLHGWSLVYAVVFSGMEEGAFYEEMYKDTLPKPTMPKYRHELDCSGH